MLRWIGLQQVLVQTPLSDEQLTVYQAQSWQTHLVSGARFIQKSTITAGGQFKPQLEGKPKWVPMKFFFLMLSGLYFYTDPSLNCTLRQVVYLHHLLQLRN